MSDPFDTASLRSATLRTWASSPTRLREDTATEADLVRGGYRDRALVELAQNAADAAARAGVEGEMWVDLVGDELRVANTGAPLDVEGVQALAALRVSGKAGVPGAGTVGRFGVGFTSVLALSDEPRILSRDGSVAFSARRTRAELGMAGAVPVLRLVWPVDEAPGADTEVVLALRDGIDGDAVLRACAEQAPERLLELTALRAITVAGTRYERTVEPLSPGVDRVGVAGRTYLRHTGPRARWLVRLIDGRAVAQGPDVLRAPTPTDEELSLPALLVADVELAPDRRRIAPGASLDGLAVGYPELVVVLEPEQRTRLVPAPGFARSAVDDELRTQVIAALVDRPWLPGADGHPVAPRAATVLDVSSPELVDVLADVVPGLLTAELSAREHHAALSTVGVHRLGMAGVVEAVSGLGREPSWWRRLYAALEPCVHDRATLGELAAMPVPLSDGRTVLGPRGTVVVASATVAEGTAAVAGLRVVHPDAVHPLLERLGATTVDPGHLLAELEAAVTGADPDEPDTAALTDTVLGLVAAGAGATPWLGSLLLPDSTGELRPADELLLPGAPLASVLVADAPFGTVAAPTLERHGADTLRTVGVGWGFTVLADDEATGPDHGLDDEARWWRECAPESVRAVRDLDLVEERAWPRALAMLHADPATAALLTERDGYTAWWLRRHAVLPDAGGELRPLGQWRSPGDDRFAGVLDEVGDVGTALLVAATVDDPDLAELLLTRLGDPAREVCAAVAARTYATLARDVDPDDVAAPERLRARDGSVVPARQACVLDGAWWAEVVPPGRQVLGDLGAGATALADLLDVGLASEEWDGPDREGWDAGVATRWAEIPEVVLTCAQLRAEVPGGTVLRHERLPVRWWFDAAGGVLHARPDGLLPALLHRLNPG